jgi:hypothetical protein
MERLYCAKVEGKGTYQQHELWSWGRGTEYALAPSGPLLLTNKCDWNQAMNGAFAHWESMLLATRIQPQAQRPCFAVPTLVDGHDNVLTMTLTRECRGALGNSFTEDVSSAHRTTYKWNCSGKPSVHAGMWHSGAVVDGQVHLWGQGKGGRLGLGDEASRLTPTPVPISSGVRTKVVLQCCTGPEGSLDHCFGARFRASMACIDHLQARPA